MSEAQFANGSPQERILVWFFAAGFAFLGFALNYELETRLDELGTFRDYNVIFDADPITQIQTFKYGRNAYGRNFSHPNLGYLTNPAVSAVAVIANRFGLVQIEDRVFRRRLALLVAPIASGLKAMAIFWMCSLMGWSLLRSCLITLIGVMSFSQLLFGSIPDHWALGGLAIALAFLLATDTLMREGRIRWWAWALVATLAAGVALTNVVIVLLIFFVVLVVSTRQLRGSVLKAAALAGVSVGLTLVIYWTGSLVYGVERHQTPEQVGKWIQRHRESDPVGKIGQFPAALANTIAPPDPGLIENRLGKQRLAKRDYQFTLLTPYGDVMHRPLGLGLLLALFVGAFLGLRGTPEQQALGWAAVAVISFNFTFHAFWGQEYFLYSQHWHAALLVLLCGLFLAGRSHPWITTGLVAALAFAVALNNMLRLEFVIEVLTRLRP